MFSYHHAKLLSKVSSNPFPESEVVDVQSTNSDSFGQARRHMPCDEASSAMEVCWQLLGAVRYVMHCDDADGRQTG